jgi:hypothetical protein
MLCWACATPIHCLSFKYSFHCLSVRRLVCISTNRENELLEAGDAGAPYDGRFLLALREAAGTLEISVDTRKGLAVTIVDRHTPMMVLATAVFAEMRLFALRHVESMKRIIHQACLCGSASQAPERMRHRP